MFRLTGGNLNLGFLFCTLSITHWTLGCLLSEYFGKLFQSSEKTLGTQRVCVEGEGDQVDWEHHKVHTSLKIPTAKFLWEKKRKKYVFENCHTWRIHFNGIYEENVHTQASCSYQATHQSEFISFGDILGENSIKPQMTLIYPSYVKISQKWRKIISFIFIKNIAIAIAKLSILHILVYRLKLCWKCQQDFIEDISKLLKCIQKDKVQKKLLCLWKEDKVGWAPLFNFMTYSHRNQYTEYYKKTRCRLK